MKKVRSFEFVPGQGVGIEALDEAVNGYIQDLEQAGADHVALKVTHTDKVVVYTVISE